MAVVDELDIALEALGYRDADGLVEAAPRIDTGRAFVWRDLQAKGRVDATYFRGAVPLIAFARAHDDLEIAGVHRRLWNLSKVPLVLAAGSGEIGVYSCFVPPAGPTSAQHARMAVVDPNADIADILEAFSRSLIETGRVALERPEFFKRGGRVDRKLLRNLRDLRRTLESSSGRQREVDELIGSSIFVRYLEDRAIITPRHLVELTGYETYLDALAAGREASEAVFDALAERFNGDVFGHAARNISTIADEDLTTIAAFLRGQDLVSGQETFWPYDFGVISPELISSIYEQLLEESQRKDAAFYTPRAVVDLMLDEVMPWDDETVPRILDPACGSGIFLTEAFRRLVFRVGQQRVRPFSFAELSSMLQSTIFGVDQSEAAIRVAAFGLYLALLEDFDPPTAWTEARLPRLLGTNLFSRDFFDEHGHPDIGEFDVIVGNPPWQEYLSDVAQDYVAKSQNPVARKQAAIAFLWRSTDLLARGGSIALLLPSKALLHNGHPLSIAVRRRIFDVLDVSTVIDLSSLRHELFESAAGPGAVLVAQRRDQREEDESRAVLYVTPHTSPLQLAVEGFVLTQDDMHTVSVRDAHAHPDIWKTLLWGSERDAALISGVRSRFPTLKEVVDKYGWIAGRGFELTGERHSAEHLKGMPLVPTSAIEPYRVTRLETVQADFMHRPRDPRLFAGPHVLIRRGLFRGRIAAALLESPAAFTNGVFGLACPAEEIEWLKLITACMNSAFGNYFQFLTSASWGVEREFVEEREHLALPIPDLMNARARNVLSVFDLGEDSGFDHAWKAALDLAVFEAYELTTDEVDLVRDTLAFSLDHFARGRKSSVFGPPSPRDLHAYTNAIGDRLRDLLGPGTVKATTSEPSEGYTGVSISFHIPPGPTEAPRSVPRVRDSGVNSLLRVAQEEDERWSSPVTVLQPSVFVMRGNTVHVLKPSERRNWTVSRARADAAEIIGQVLWHRSATAS